MKRPNQAPMAQPFQPKSIRPAAPIRPADSVNAAAVLNNQQVTTQNKWTAEAKATIQERKQEQGVKKKISEESQSLLHAALADSSSLQGQKGPLDEDDGPEAFCFYTYCSATIWDLS